MSTELATSVRKQREWPTREQFLESRSGPYFDRMDNLGCSTGLYHYATRDEVMALFHVLRERYSVLGRELKQIKTALGPQAQQPGETLLVWHSRVFAMSASDQARVQEWWARRFQRQDINQLLRDMDHGTVPTRGRNSNVAHIGEKPPLLRVIQDRYEVAYRAALEKRWTEIDEADWQRELKRRARIEAAD